MDAADEERRVLNEQIEALQALEDSDEHQMKIAELLKKMSVLLDAEAAQQQQQDMSACFSYTLDGGSVQLTLWQQQALIDSSALGHVVWRGAFALSKYLERHFIFPSSPFCVVELGCGVGLVGLICAAVSSNCTKVVLTDGSLSCVHLAEKNARFNRNARANPQCQVESRVLVWGEENGDFLSGAHLVVGAELVSRWYDSKALVETLKQTHHASCEVVISFQWHDEASPAEFLRNAEESFHVIRVSDDLIDERYRSKSLWIVRLKRK